MNNKNLIKKLLATASTVAVIASSGSAVATDYITVGGNGVTNAGTNIRSVAGAAPQAVGDANHTVFLGGAHDLKLSQATTGTNTHTVNLYGNNGQTIEIHSAVRFAVTNDIAAPAAASAGAANNGAVAAGAGAANAKAVVKLTAAVDATLTGGLANISQVDFANKNNSITVTAAETFTGTTFKSSGGDNGNLVLDADVTIKNGVFTANANALATLTVNAGKTVTLSGNTDATNVVNGLTVNGDGHIIAEGTANAGKVTLGAANGRLTVNGGANAGNVDIQNAGIVTANTTGTINEVKFGNAGAVLNLHGGTVTNVVANGAVQGTVNVHGDSKATLAVNGNHVKEVAFKENATLTLGGASQAEKITAAEDKAGVIKTGANNLTVKFFGEADKGSVTVNFEANNQTLTISNGGTFFGNVTSNNGGVGTGKVVFDTDLEVKGTIGTSAYTVADVEVNAGKKVDFGASLVKVAELKLAAANSKATLSAAHENMKITGAVANEGLVVFTNKEALVVSGIGEGIALHTVTLGEGNVKVSGDHAKFNNLHFGAEDSSNAVLEVKNLDLIAAAGTQKITTAKKGGVIAFRDNSVLQVNLGTADNSLTALRLVTDGDHTLDLNGKSTFGAVVLADKANRLAVTGVGANAANTVYAGFGTKTEYMKSVAFAQTGAANTTTVNGVMFADNLTFVGADTNLVFGNGTDFAGVAGKDDKSTFKFSNAANKATFKDNAGLAINVVADAPGDGILEFEGSTMTQDLGGTNALNLVDFKDKKEAVRIIGGDINSQDIKFGAGQYMFNQDTSAGGGNTEIKSGAVLNLDKDVTLTLTDDVTFTGKAELHAHQTAKLDASTATSFKAAKLDVTVSSITISDGDVSNPAFIKFTDAVKSLEAKDIVLNASGNRLMDYQLGKGADAHTLALTAKANRERYDGFLVNEAKIEGNTLELARALAAEKVSGGALNLLTLITGTASVSDVKESLGRIAATPSVSAISSDVAAMSLSDIGARQAGVGAGDEDSRMNLGVWGQAFGSRATQKERKGDAGYKANTAGGTVGVDALMSDNTTIGIAASFGRSNVKFKDAKDGDKAKSNNMFFSVYGRHNLADNWFLTGAAGFGSGNVKADSKRLIGSKTYDTASAKYDVMSFALEARVGYDYTVADSVTLMPTLGLRYINVNEGGYSEAGSLQNRTITKRSSDKLTGIFGSVVQGNMDMVGTVVMPEVHAFVNYDLKSKNPRIEAKLDGMTKAIDVSAAKAEKLSYNLGAGLKAKSGVVEYGVGYDAKLAKKYVSHQGTLRLKVDL